MKCPKCLFENPDKTRFCGNCGNPFPDAIEISPSLTETFEPAPEDLPIGSTFAGRYQIIEELGRGGMGRVYKVLDTEVQEKIALKILRPEIASNEQTIQRFRNELKLARKISHKYVCRMFDLSKEEDLYYITMEYVSGENLKSMIQMMGQLSVGKTIFIAKQVCEGLAEAHRLGVIHRDLKPSNIMIDKEGNAHIMDFGIARSLKTEDITQTEARIGTPKYMSPEQMAGKELDRRSDIYSLGVILYEMVTGRVPYEGDTAAEIAVKQDTEFPTHPRKINPQIPQNLSSLILSCIQKDKDMRFKRVEDILDELSKIEQEIPTTDRIYPSKKTEMVLPDKRFLSLRFLGIIVFLAALLIAGFFLIKRELRKPLHTVAPTAQSIVWKNSIAVLPFEDLSLDRDQEYFCIGMTEAIITKLTSIEGLRVVPYQTVSRYKDTEKSLEQIGKELGIETILAPTLKKEDNRIRVSAQLANVRENYVIDAYTYEEELNSVFEVEDSISKSIADALKIHLEEEKLHSIKKREPKNIKAYEFYTRGKYFEGKYRESNFLKDFEDAIKNYKNAFAIDPNYALAYWGLGNCYESVFANFGKKEHLDLLLENYNQAYELDPNLAEANVGLAWAYFYTEEWSKSYSFCKNAIKLDPYNPEVNFNVGAILRSTGLYPQAIEFYSKAIALDPLSVNYRRLAASCYTYMGRYNESIRLIEEALELNPDNNELRLFTARQYILMKRYNEAEQIISQVEKQDPKHPDIQYTRALIYAVHGKNEKALPIIEDLDPYFFTFLLSSVYAALGMKDEAIQNIGTAVERGFFETKSSLHSYPSLINNHFYDNLRNDPRFQRIVEQEKKKYEENIMEYEEAKPTK
ncbi:MAG: protein kinase [Candidatus Aminicenantes bacterium]|nr:protein kinase [Candidatus Aminicenantes bacterium]MDH5743420.1 protein kinase [Candidatus Aminicenantes bacterium]